MSRHTKVGKYEIVGVLGEGAMGVVYRAVDPVLNRTLAIKVMSEGIANDADLRARFSREAQTAGSLQHPNIVTVYDFGETEGHLFIAMEYVEGTDLEQLLASPAPLSLVAKLDITIDVLQGLSHAHKHGLIHRDIKPANIRIDTDGRAKIMDFGIARLDSSNMTRTGMAMGTPNYMAPEQITGEALSPASDLFSVGAVLYELLSGTKPFPGTGLHEVLFKVVTVPAPDLGASLTDLPIGLNGIVTRALQKDPAKRYPNALEMANALIAVRANVSGAGITARSISLNRTIATSLELGQASAAAANRKRRRMLMGSGIGVAVLALGGAVALLQKGRGATDAVVPVPPPATSAIASNPVAPQPTATPSQPPTLELAPSAPARSGRNGVTPTPPAPETKGAPLAVAPPGSAPAGASAPAASELAMFRRLQASGIDVRKSASDAGATPLQLQPGDDHNRRAEMLILQGKADSAADRIDLAIAAWREAERLARAAAAAAAATSAPTKTVAPPPALPPASVPVPAPTTAAPSPPPNPEIAITAAVAAYSRAIDSRDITQLRRAYPGMTADQQKNWDQFYAQVRTLHAPLSVSNIVVTGATAEARLSGTYEYTLKSGNAQPQRQPVSFQATFRRTDTGWEIVALR